MLPNNEIEGFHCQLIELLYQKNYLKPRSLTKHKTTLMWAKHEKCYGPYNSTLCKKAGYDF